MGFHGRQYSLEAVELHYLKHILHVPLTASNIAVRGELGQLPIHLIWKDKILRYWDRLCSNDIPMLLKEAVALAHQLGQSGKKCWLIGNYRNYLMQLVFHQLSYALVVRTPCAIY